MSPSRSEQSAVDMSFAEAALYEVIAGRRVELLPMGAFPTQIASRITIRLGQFDEEHRMGRVNSEMLYRLDESTGLERRPDVAFVSFDQWPRDRPVPEDSAWAVVPDLAVEVVSPTDRVEDLLEKVERDYGHIRPRMRVTSSAARSGGRAVLAIPATTRVRS